MARTRSATGALPKEKDNKVNVEEMKEKLEAQLKLQRAAHQQRKGAAAAAAANSTSASATPETPKSTQHVIKIVPNTPGKLNYKV